MYGIKNIKSYFIQSRCKKIKKNRKSCKIFRNARSEESNEVGGGGQPQQIFVRAAISPFSRWHLHMMNIIKIGRRLGSENMGIVARKKNNCILPSSPRETADTS